jgi:hypothetical protein
LFDSLLLLGSGGVTVYNGPPLLTERWFGIHGFTMPSYENMADFNLDVVSGKVFKAGDPFFKKEALALIWESSGRAFVSTHTAQRVDNWRESFKLPPEVRARLFNEFLLVDHDASGALDPSEMKDLFANLGLDVADEVRRHKMSLFMSTFMKGDL